MYWVRFGGLIEAIHSILFPCLGPDFSHFPAPSSEHFSSLIPTILISHLTCLSLLNVHLFPSMHFNSLIGSLSDHSSPLLSAFPFPFLHQVVAHPWIAYNVTPPFALVLLLFIKKSFLQFHSSPFSVFLAWPRTFVDEKSTWIYRHWNRLAFT